MDVLFIKSHKTAQDRNCALWDPVVKLSKGTEEFINRLKVSFISENVNGRHISMGKPAENEPKT